MKSKKKKKPRIKGVTCRPMLWYFWAGYIDAKRRIVTDNAQDITSPRILEKAACFHSHVTARFRYLEEDEAGPLYLEAAGLTSEWYKLRNASVPPSSTSARSADIRSAEMAQSAARAELSRKSAIEVRVPVIRASISLLVADAVIACQEALFEVERRLNTYLRGVAAARHTSEHSIHMGDGHISHAEQAFWDRHADEDKLLQAFQLMLQGSEESKV